jgi:hypothetical protein
MPKRNSEILTRGLAVLLILLGVGCADSSDESPQSDRNANQDRNRIVVADLQFDFERDRQGWSAGVVGYPQGDESRLNFSSGIERNPVNSGVEGSSLRLRGDALSPAMIYYVYRRFGRTEGLERQTIYAVSIGLRWVTDQSTQCIGPGGSPGEADLIAAASGEEPKRTVNQDGVWELNLKRGDFVMLGNLGYDGVCDRRFRMQEKSTRLLSRVQTDENGNAWLVLGFSPVAISTHEIYVNTLEVTFSTEGTQGQSQNSVTTP